MRDWKATFPTISSASAEFIDYLWGIERMESQETLQEILKFIDYLWGIERLEQVLRPSRTILFIDYLWGIERSGLK